LRVWGFATTARLQVACACSQVVYADKSGQQYHHPTAKDYHESERALQHEFRKKQKTSTFDRVMKLTNGSLCAFIEPQVEERCIRWKTNANFLA
jgi:hypothetical protein